MTEPEAVSGGRLASFERGARPDRVETCGCQVWTFVGTRLCTTHRALDAATQEVERLKEQLADMTQGFHAEASRGDELEQENERLEDHKAMLNATLSAVVEARDKLRRDHEAEGRRVAALMGALREADEEIMYWHPEYLEGGQWYEHPRGSGWDRIHKRIRALLADHGDQR